MIALPLLFEIFNNVKGFKFFPFRVIRSKPVIILIIISLFSAVLEAQEREIRLNEILEIALKNNEGINAYSLKVDESVALKATAFDPDKTLLSYGYDQNNIALNGYPLAVWGIEQNFSFPTLYGAEMNARKIDVSKARTTLELRKQSLMKEISGYYYEIQNLRARYELYRNIDSLYTVLLRNAEARYSKGDFSQLDLLNIRARQQQARLDLNSTEYSILNYFQRLRTLMNFDEDFTIPDEIEIIAPDEKDIESNPAVQLLKLQNAYDEAVINIERNKMLPDLSLNYFTGTNRYENSRFYHGFQFGVSVPLFFGSQRSRIESSRISLNAQQLITDNEIKLLRSKVNELKRAELKYRESIEFYDSAGRLLHDEILRTALRSYQSGEIDLLKFTDSFQNAVRIKVDYLDNVLGLNSIILEQMYLTNQ